MESDGWLAQSNEEIYHLGSHSSYTNWVKGLLDRRLADLTTAGTLNNVTAAAAVADTIRDARYMIAAFNQIEAASTGIPLRLC